LLTAKTGPTQADHRDELVHPRTLEFMQLTNAHRDEGLREHLLAAGAGQPSVQPLPQHPPHPQHSQQHPHAAGPPHAIDPAIGGSAYDMSADGPDDGNTSDGRSKGRRELSTSKRAAQNRAAQVRTPGAYNWIILTLSARISPAQGRVHQAAEGPSQGV
jgi:hypothetical protein